MGDPTDDASAPAFDPLGTLSDDEKTRFNTIKDDPQFGQLCTDIQLIRKMQNAQTAFDKAQSDKDKPPEKKSKGGMFDWLAGDG